MPGDRLASPEAAKESTVHDGVGMNERTSTVARKAQRQHLPCGKCGEPWKNEWIVNVRRRFVAPSRLLR